MLEEAVANYRKVLVHDPGAAEVYNNLGLALQGQGKLNEAVAGYRKALALKPDFAGAYANLGNALQGQGNLAEAVICYEKAISCKPDFAEVYYNLGVVLSAQKKHDAAIENYRHALLYRPDNLAACINLGNTLRERGRLEEAAECYRNVILLKPDFVEAHNNLGMALKELGELDEAIACHLQAISLKPDYADSHVALANAYFDLGRFDAVQSVLSEVLKMQPEHPSAWAMLAGSRKMTLADGDWLTTALRLASSPASAEEGRMALWFAIGKYYDDTKQHDLAFPAYQQANMLAQQRSGEFDRTEFSRFIDGLIAAYPAERLGQQQEAASPSRLPVLIVGMPRSGTSLTEQIIASHPAAFGAGELRFWGEQFRANQATMLTGVHEAQLTARLAEAYMQCLRRYSPEALRIVDKMPHNFIRVGPINEVFPQAKIIHVRRNPVDTCLSIYFQNLDSRHNYATSLEDLAFYYREYVRLMRHWRAVIPADCFLEVSYEALIEDTSGWSRRIVEFIGLEWDERCLDFHRTERKVGTSSNWQVRQKIYHSSMARWRHYEKHLEPLLGLLELD